MPSPALSPTDLRVEGLVQPMAVGTAEPRFSWRAEGAGPGSIQSAYRIVVASTRANLEDRRYLWDSGRRDDAQCVDIPYGGPSLRSREECWWSVEVWDAAGQAASAEPQRWRMGLLSSKDWSAAWLAAENAAANRERQTPMAWSWGESTDSPQKREFRLPLSLSRPADRVELLVVVNDWWWFTQIVGGWVDDKVVIPLREWAHRSEGAFDGVGLPSSRSVEVGPLEEGEHVVTVVVEFDPGDGLRGLWHDGSDIRGIPVMPGLAVHATVHTAGVEPTVLALTKTGVTRTSSDLVWRPVREVGIDYEPWRARPATVLRHEFELPSRPRAAWLYSTSLGVYEGRLNGARVGTSVLDPGPAQYAERVRYQAHDVLDLVQPGRNALGFTVADGWFAGFDGRFSYAPAPRRMLAQLEIELVDGGQFVVTTGPGWERAESEIRESTMKAGEFVDRRLEQPGWDQPRFNAVNWEMATVAESPGIRLEPEVSQPIVISERLRPAVVLEHAGRHIVDFGVDLSGWCRVLARGSRGAEVVVRYAQALNGDGDLDQTISTMDATGVPRIDRYILSGAPEELLEPRFTYRGFRYVSIEGLPELLEEDVTAAMVHTDLELTGEIKSSEPLVERLYNAIVQTQRCTFAGVQVDNASRELRGWMGDSGFFAETAMFTMDTRTFYRRWMRDILDGQRADGSFPIAAPAPRRANALFNDIPGSPPGWGDTAVAFAHAAWWQYGDAGIVRDCWSAIMRHLESVERSNPDRLWMRGRHLDFGDWLSIVPTDPDVIATAMWSRSLERASRMARAIGRSDDADALDSLHTEVGDAFAKAFVSADGVVGPGTQTAQALGLMHGLVPLRARAAAAERLAVEVQRAGSAPTTGILGTEILLDVLADNGLGRLAYDLLLRRDPPSWGHMLREGGTIWEAWEDLPARRSRSQPALGAVGGFLFRRFAGIAASAPGFAAIIVDPCLDLRVQEGGGRYDSVRGSIRTSWKLTSQEYRLTVEVPANSVATVRLPLSATNEVWVDGVPGVELREAQIGPGEHFFLVNAPQTEPRQK